MSQTKICCGHFWQEIPKACSSELVLFMFHLILFKSPNENEFSYDSCHEISNPKSAFVSLTSLPFIPASALFSEICHFLLIFFTSKIPNNNVKSTRTLHGKKATCL